MHKNFDPTCERDGVYSGSRLCHQGQGDATGKLCVLSLRDRGTIVAHSYPSLLFRPHGKTLHTAVRRNLKLSSFSFNSSIRCTEIRVGEF